MFLKIMYLLCCGKIFKTIIFSNTFSRHNNIIINGINSKKSSGYDERYSVNNTYNNINSTQLGNIVQFFDKKKLLNILEDDNVSLYTKIILLKNNNIKKSSLFAGGLLNQFDFPDF